MATARIDAARTDRSIIFPHVECEQMWKNVLPLTLNKTLFFALTHSTQGKSTT